jgi:hypothetical protein
MEKIIFLFTFVFTLSWTYSIPKEQELQLGNTALTRSRMITLSNVLPVQFWLEDEETFNEKQVCGIEPVCWCMPWNCADPLLFQFTDSFVVVEPEPEEVTEDAVLPALSTGENLAGVNTDWAEGATPSVTFPEQTGSFGTYHFTSDYLIFDYAFIEGDDYEFTFGLSATTTFASLRLVLFDNLNNQEYSDSIQMLSNPDTLVFGFTAPAGAVKFGIRVSRTVLHPGGTIAEFTTTVDSMSGTHTFLEEPEPPAPPDPVAYKLQILNTNEDVIQALDYDATLLNSTTYIYSLELTPEELGYCDNQVIFRIIDADASPDLVVATSDCVQIKTSSYCTIPIDYSNNKDFNNLIFEDLSPSPTFRIRIPAVFFHEDNPSEQESTELSNGETVRLWNKIEERRHLQIGFLPHYMHRKIQMILMCDNITIDGKNWIRKEAYEKVEGNRLYPLKKANVWLHDKEFIKENQL